MGKGLIISLLIIIFLIIVGTIAFVFIYKDTYYHNKAVKENDSVLCEKIGDERKSANCYSAIALINAELSICTKSPKLYLMTCFNNFARENNDITLCGAVTPGVDEYNCYYAFTQIYPELSICNNLQGEPKEYCYTTVAMEKNDESICDQLPKESLYNENCKENVRNMN